MKDNTSKDRPTDSGKTTFDGKIYSETTKSDKVTVTDCRQGGVQFLYNMYFLQFSENLDLGFM